ncbi:hypothetical protein [Thauera sp. 2A1]|uniref:hypothetical protein n=1 Tax=Thauera sp. 2A1 TaxID=2570191 RepID=UPI001D178F99|nr:hypothetical protein [Thauera sp. 2A1]KAI5913254.1 hypothetical protein GH664_18555 [Thauera sp. 2A1]
MNDSLTLHRADAVADLQPHAPGQRRRSRRTLILLAIVCVLPVLASYFTFYLWQPQGRVNHGTLLTPAMLPATVLDGVSGQAPLARAELERRWTLVFAAPAACDAACARALYVSRQARLAQAQDAERVARVWLVTDSGTPAAPALAAQEGLRLARADAAWLAALGADAVAGAVFLVDPLGNVMMRFDDDSDSIRAARGLTKDLQRLLKYSALGRGAKG